MVRWDGGPNVGRRRPHGEKHGVPEFFLVSAVDTGVRERAENWVGEKRKNSLAMREGSVCRVALVPVECAWTSTITGKA